MFLFGRRFQVVQDLVEVLGLENANGRERGTRTGHTLATCSVSVERKQATSLRSSTQIVAHQFFLIFLPVQNLLKPRSSQVGHRDQQGLAGDRQNGARIPPGKPNFRPTGNLVPQPPGGRGHETPLSLETSMIRQCRQHTPLQRCSLQHMHACCAQAPDISTIRGHSLDNLQFHTRTCCACGLLYLWCGSRAVIQ